MNWREHFIPGFTESGREVGPSASVVYFLHGCYDRVLVPVIVEVEFGVSLMVECQHTHLRLVRPNLERSGNVGYKSV